MKTKESLLKQTVQCDESNLGARVQRDRKRMETMKSTEK